ncbi:MAG: DUF5007 domain-containing protein [Bacteroidota bacterium]
MNKNNIIQKIILPALFLCMLTACKKFVPQERETVGADSQFIIDNYQPIIGRTTVFRGNFYKGSTTFPADFSIVNPRRRNGDAAPELTNVFPVQVWKAGYNGAEKSIAEIEAKREMQFRPLFEVSPHSGEFTMWAEAKSSFIRPQPDSGYLFDVELSNSGGRRFYKNLRLMPFRERPYEPSNINPVSGQPTSNGVNVSVLQNVKGITTNRYMSGNDIEVYIRKLVNTTGGAGNSITFRFLDTLFNPIDPAMFANTDWANLVHGFNMKKTTTGVTYDAAFPVPLVVYPTRYTNSDGSRARVRFGYSRIGFGNVREDAVFGLDFALFEKGEWEIVFAFKNDNPKFIND